MDIRVKCPMCKRMSQWYRWRVTTNDPPYDLWHAGADCVCRLGYSQREDTDARAWAVLRSRVWPPNAD